jgi:Uma2 family endonuclease
VSARIEPILTVSDLDSLPDDGNRYELIEGELYVSRAPSLSHQMIITNLIASIKTYLDAKPIGVVVPGPGVLFSSIDGVIPDIVYFSNEKKLEIVKGERLGGATELVVEIVSPGIDNKRRDRIVKRHLYSKFGVHEYWIVDPEKKILEVYKLSDRTLVLVDRLNADDQFTTQLLPGLTIELKYIFN